MVEKTHGKLYHPGSWGRCLPVSQCQNTRTPKIPSDSFWFPFKSPPPQTQSRMQPKTCSSRASLSCIIVFNLEVERADKLACPFRSGPTCFLACGHLGNGLKRGVRFIDICFLDSSRCFNDSYSYTTCVVVFVTCICLHVSYTNYTNVSISTDPHNNCSCVPGNSCFCAYAIRIPHAS